MPLHDRGLVFQDADVVKSDLEDDFLERTGQQLVRVDEAQGDFEVDRR